MATVSQSDVGRLRDLFHCPISYQLFEDPVIEEEGSCRHTFERAWIMQWLDENPTCPISRDPLRIEQLVAHTILRDACALLNPERVESLTQEDLDLLSVAEEAFLNREGARVPRTIHESIMKRLAKKISAYSKNVYDC